MWAIVYQAAEKTSFRLPQQDPEAEAELESKTFLGDITIYNLSIKGTKLRGKTTQPDRELVAGSKAHVRLPADKVKIFPK